VVEECNPPEEPGSSAGASFSPRAKTYTHPRVCRNLDQFQAWQRSRPWLSLNSETGNLKCTSCAEVKQTGLHTQKGQHYESAFIDGTVQSLTAKKLLIYAFDDAWCFCGGKCRHATHENLLLRRRMPPRTRENLFCGGNFFHILSKNDSNPNPDPNRHSRRLT